jgi:hypothetical protein
MIFFAAVAVLLFAASTLLVFAGREFLRVNGYPPVQARSAANLLHLMSLGYSALNEASEEAARRRVNRPCW